MGQPHVTICGSVLYSSSTEQLPADYRFDDFGQYPTIGYTSSSILLFIQCDFRNSRSIDHLFPHSREALRNERNDKSFTGSVFVVWIVHGNDLWRSYRRLPRRNPDLH